jgi:hypothetical protein
VKPRTTAALWTVFTVTAVATGLGAVTIVRNALTAPAAATLTPAQVVAELGSMTPAPTPTVAVTSPSPTSSSTRPHPRTSGSHHPTGGASTSAPPEQPTRTTSPPATGSTRTLASRGGTAVGRCTPDGVYLQSWSPAPGYQVEEVERGPGSHADVWFEGPYEVHLVVTCAGGVPVGQVEQEVNDG